MTIRFDWRPSLLDPDFPAADLAQLHDAVDAATPFNRLAWLRGAELALEPTQRLRVLLGWHGEHLVLCLPLVHGRERKAGMAWPVVRHLGFPLSDRLALLATAQALPAMPRVLEEIRRELPHAWLQLSELLAADGALASWREYSSYSACAISCRAPEHRIVAADREEARDKPLRYELRRAKKRCAEIDARVIRVNPDGEGMDALLDFIGAVEQASWKGADGLGIFSGARRQQWMRSALRELAADGCVRVVLLEHQGRCISYRLGLLERGRLYDYNIAFLPDYASLGSGRLLLDEWIRWGLDDGWQWVDASRVSLSRSSHQLHERMNGQVEHQRWSFYSRRPDGLLLGLADRLWQTLKPHVKTWRERRAARPPKESRP
ncbi:GNAT family N-acetyltransferase [Pseudomonas chlororaphis]|uniref:Cellulose biosynthesis protein n=1 Tax=Pseudomonas chlororaphis TaxID=587753 RepID=A0A1Q8EQX4_9PSED|nr:GNAT family N-acetyltransferase [Pseudomonas chlororaphis]OLF54202.1 cellulose biosynthesis protein [Pseudomonas chlororaphis]